MIDELLGLPFAHRGLHDETTPENSLAAFESAVRRGFGIELDVRLSADDVPVVFHDASLRRMCGLDLAVSDLTAAELRRTCLLGTPEGVPTLAEALEVIGDRTPVLVDVKSGLSRRRRSVGAVARLLRADPGAVGVVGFDPWLLAAMRELAPRVLRGQSAGVAPDVARRWWARHACRPVDELWSLRISGPDFVTFNVERLPSVTVARIRCHLPVVAWTVRTAATYRLAQRLADGVIVEDAAVTLAEAELQAGVLVRHAAVGCAGSPSGC